MSLAPVMPALFIGHGSPMNIILDNAYTRSLSALSERLPKPKAIIAFSAHWETAHTELLALESPKTIYDFGGFPPALYELNYPAPGSPKLVDEILALLSDCALKSTQNWGFDHGVWAVLRWLFPKADVPVIPVSLSKRFTLSDHLSMAKAFARLRAQGYMILGSGNVTHNLGDLAWDDPAAAPFAWAKEFDTLVKEALEIGNESLLTSFRDEAHWKRAHPRREHYVPLLYILGARQDSESVKFVYEGFEHGSLSMRSFAYGL